MGHGKSRTRLYKVWSGMKDRCYNKNSKGYHHYGGRGITICNEWTHDFMTFYKWAMESGYDETAPRGQYTIERIDNEGPYSPENCRWATMKEQERNKRSNIKVQVDNKTLTLVEACENFGLDYGRERKIVERRSKGITPRGKYLSEAEQKRAAIRKAIEENPGASIRSLAKITGQSKSNVQRVKASFAE